MIKIIVCAALAATTLAAPFHARTTCDGTVSCCDKSDICGDLISSGEKTCAADFCSTCDFAGFCDESCDTCDTKPSGGSGGDKPVAGVTVTADESPKGVFTISFETSSSISGFEIFNDGRDEANCVLESVTSLSNSWSFTLGDSTGTVVGLYNGKDGATGSGSLCTVSGTITQACTFAFEDTSGNEVTYTLSLTHGGSSGNSDGGTSGGDGKTVPCEDLISSGQRTCADDFCSTCEFAGVCDDYC